MTRCNYCKAELLENEPICSYCNMYNKEQMLENERIKEDISNSKVPNQEVEKDKQQSTATVIKCLLPAVFVLTVGLFFFLKELLPYSTFDEGISIMFGLFGIPIGFICTIVGLLSSINEVRKNPKNKIAKNSIAMIIFGITAALFSDSIFGILILGIEIIIYTVIDKK